MKAVIMAGGRGLRLHPMSIGCSKPLIPVFDRPVIEHILKLLRNHGIREVRATLQYMPYQIIRYFEDNPPEGIDLTFSIEDEPLGTAGSVALCRDFLDDDFLVISGDAICDIDLSACIKRHRENRAEATLVLYKHPKPLEYGLVMTKPDGRVERFIEKPSWSQVFCDTVNTGIYILSPKVLDRIKPGVKVDFAKDVFSEMLSKGAELYGTVVDGYWCDIGNTEAYADCHFDILSGKADIDIGKMQAEGYWVMSEIAEGVILKPPVYIGKDVRISPGAVIGPYAVVGSNSNIGPGTTIEYSVLNGANVLRGSEIRGSVLCAGSTIGRDVTVSEGCVIGESSQVEDSVSLSPGVKVWPGLRVRRGGSEKWNIYSEHGGRGELPFDSSGGLKGDLIELSPDVCLRIGFALGREGNVAIGCNLGRNAEALSEAISCGVRTSGANAIRNDSRFFAEAAFAGDLFGATLSVFVEEIGEQIRIRLAGRAGAIPAHDIERKLNLVVRSATPMHGKIVFGANRYVIGTTLAYERELLRRVSGRPAKVRIQADNLPSKLLRNVLEKSGCIDHTSDKYFTISVSNDGTKLYVTDEFGNRLGRDMISALLLLIHFREGNRVCSIPFDAPQALEQIAKMENARVVRRGRDSDYWEYIDDSIFLRDALMAAIKLCGYVSKANQRVASVCEEIPVFQTVSRDFHFAGDRGSLMRNLSAVSRRRELGDGIRFPMKEGWVHVSPDSSRPVIRVIAESVSVEAAEELCADIRALIEENDL